jgi:hypothetical protein
MSTLNPDDEQKPVVRQTGHDNASLGPSDSSDSGSDVAGAKRHEFDIDSELDNHALEAGEAELASDSDRAGTGERASADGDSTLEENEDIDVDRIESAAGEEGVDEDIAGAMVEGSVEDELAAGEDMESAEDDTTQDERDQRKGG